MFLRGLVCTLFLLSLATQAQQPPKEPYQALQILREMERNQDFEGIRRLGRAWRSSLPCWSPTDLSTQDVLACLAERGDPEFLRSLLPALPAGPGRAQIARSVAGTWGTLPPTPRGWLNLPRGSLVLPAVQTRCAAADAHHLYAGTTWGLAIYDRESHPVARVALGQEVRFLEVAGGFVWAATDQGLFRIDPDQGSVVKIALPSVRIEDLFRQDEFLWILTSTHLQRLEPSTMELLLVRAPGYGLRRGQAQGDAVWVQMSGNLDHPVGVYRAADDSWSVDAGKKVLPTAQPGPSIRTRPTSDTLPGDLSSFVEMPGESLWQSGDRTAVLSDDLTVMAWVGPQNGRPSFERGLAFRGRAYFASFSEVISYDPRTRVFRTYRMPDEEEGEGLYILTDQGQIEARDGQLWWVGEEIERSFQPETGEFGPLLARHRSPMQRPEEEQLPFLGGRVQGESLRAGRRLLWGERGLVCLNGPVQALEFTTLQPKVNLSRHERWQAEADQVREANYETQDLNGYLASENPYIRRWALQESSNRRTGIPSETLERCLADSDAGVRRLALWTLASRPEDAGPELFRPSLQDQDRDVRVAAAWGLVLRRERPPADLLEAVGRLAFHGELYLVAGPNDLPLLTKFPFFVDLKPKQEARELLLANPQWLPTLLASEEGRGFDFWIGLCQPEIFPQLYPFLKSKDPKVREGAARICAYFPRTESGEPLLDAALVEPDPMMRARLAFALGRTGYRPALVWLGYEYAQEAPLEAAMATHAIDPSVGERFLLKLCQDPVSDTRRRAVRQLASADSTPAGLERARAMLGDADREVQLAAALTLLEWRDPVGQERVLEWLRDPDRDLLEALMLVSKGRLDFAREALVRISKTSTIEAELAWQLLMYRF